MDEDKEKETKKFLFKAQASAPFEVLVAVILMGFVITAGTLVIINLNQNVCIGDKRDNMSDLKQAIEDVVQGSDLAIKNISFDIKPCFKEEYEHVSMINYDNPTKCSAYCNGGNNCTLLEYTFDDGKTRKQPIAPICMNIPTAISFETLLSNCIPGTEADQNNWEALDLSASPSPDIKAGKYRLFMESTSGDNSSRLFCFLKKK